MDVNQSLALLAGLSPAQFMRRHWQKKPLLVRQAVPGFQPLLSRAALFKLAASEHVESRLIVQQAKGWRMKQGPLAPRSLPPLSQKAWTLLVKAWICMTPGRTNCCRNSVLFPMRGLTI